MVFSDFKPPDHPVELPVQVRVCHRVTQCAITVQFFFPEIKPEHLTQRFGQIFRVYRARNIMRNAKNR